MPISKVKPEFQLPVVISAEHIFSRFETALKTFVRQIKFYSFEEYSDCMKNL